MSGVDILQRLQEKDGEGSVGYVDILQPDVDIPGVHTMYWCSIHRIDDRLQRQKLQIVASEPVINSTSGVSGEQVHNVVHHMFLYACYLPPDSDFSQYARGDICNADTNPPQWAKCIEIVGGWAVGGQGFIYPDQAGVPFGGGSGITFIQIEVHYNVEFRQGIVDSSGMRLYYTSRLRPYDAGSMFFGVVARDIPTSTQMIPPHQEEFVTYGHCHSACTDASLPDTGVRVFAALQHTHLLGRKVVTRHFRNRTELRPVIADEHYDFNYQDLKHTREITILPGDHMTVECHYDSRSKGDHMTYGGYSTNDEMCLSFILYYPRIPLLECISRTALEAQLAPFGMTELTEDRLHVSGTNESWQDVLSQVNWTDPVNGRRLQEANRYGHYLHLCRQRNNTYPQGTVGYAVYPEVVHEYVDPADAACEDEPTPAPVSEWSHSLYLDGVPSGAEQPNYLLRWSLLNQTHIKFNVLVRTVGWIGFGISPNGGMRGSDIVMMWIANGEVHFSDRFAKDWRLPQIDSQQDWVLVTWSQNVTHTSVTFLRPLDTCDDLHDRVIHNNTNRIVWAYGDLHPTQAPQGTDSNVLALYHGTLTRGSKSLSLLQSGSHTERVSPPAGSEVTQITMDNMLLPHDTDTVYWCRIVRRKFTGKIHMLGHDIVVTRGNEQFVHHMMLYRCDSDVSYLVPDNIDDMPGYRCGGPDTAGVEDNMYRQFCTHLITGWAVGDTGTVYENNLVRTLAEESGGEDYFLLEIHYDNPSRTAGVRDSSGLSLFYTEDIRSDRVEIGTLKIGSDVSWTPVIPPGLPAFTTYSFCHKDCTHNLLPDSGVTLTSVTFHTHGLGRRLTLRHLRPGSPVLGDVIEVPPVEAIQLAPVATEDSFDFAYQRSYELAEPRLLLPGDELLLACQYDSTARENVTYGGYSTGDEMCVAYLDYYPKQSLTGCYTSLDQYALIRYLVQLAGVTKFTLSEKLRIITSPKQYAGMSWQGYVNAVLSSSDQGAATGLQDVMDDGRYTAACGAVPGDVARGNGGLWLTSGRELPRATGQPYDTMAHRDCPQRSLERTTNSPHASSTRVTHSSRSTAGTTGRVTASDTRTEPTTTPPACVCEQQQQQVGLMTTTQDTNKAAPSRHALPLVQLITAFVILCFVRI